MRLYIKVLLLAMGSSSQDLLRGPSERTFTEDRRQETGLNEGLGAGLGGTG